MTSTEYTPDADGWIVEVRDELSFFALGAEGATAHAEYAMPALMPFEERVWEVGPDRRLRPRSDLPAGEFTPAVQKDIERKLNGS